MIGEPQSESADEISTEVESPVDEPAPAVDESFDGESFGMDGFDFSNMFDEKADEEIVEGSDDDA